MEEEVVFGSGFVLGEAEVEEVEGEEDMLFLLYMNQSGRHCLEGGLTHLREGVQAVGGDAAACHICHKLLKYAACKFRWLPDYKYEEGFLIMPREYKLSFFHFQ